MKILSAIGRFFARIGRWIKETAWIQPLLIVGAIFAIIFAIPHIIDGVKSWFDESDAANKFYANYQLSLENADKYVEGVGSSKVDELFTYIEEGNKEKVVKMTGGERFFIAFVEKDSSSASDLYGGFKTLKDKWKNDEFYKGDEGLHDKGDFKLKTIYTDTTNDDDENLFDKVWSNHISLFETMSDGNYLPNTYYAINNKYKESNYSSNFFGDDPAKCPMNTPLVMYFDYTDSNPIDNQKVQGLSDVIFSVEGSSDLEKARTLKNCWVHADRFGKILQNKPLSGFFFYL